MRGLSQWIRVWMMFFINQRSTYHVESRRGRPQTYCRMIQHAVAGAGKMIDRRLDPLFAWVKPSKHLKRDMTIIFGGLFSALAAVSYLAYLRGELLVLASFFAIIVLTAGIFVGMRLFLPWAAQFCPFRDHQLEAMLLRSARSEEGHAAVDYGVPLALIAIVCAAALIFMDSLPDWWFKY